MFFSKERLNLAIQFYEHTPKYCKDHNTKLIPSVNPYTSDKNSKFVNCRFMRLVCLVSGCKRFDKALVDWTTKNPN